MAILFSRQIRIAVAGLVITEPRIAFTIERQVDQSQTTGEVRLYNRAPETIDRISDRATDIVVEAGYPETISSVFEGQVQRVQKPRTQLAHITRISLGDTVRGEETVGAVTVRSYAGPVNLRVIVGDVVGDMGLMPGPMDAIPAGATVTDFVWSGPSADALTTVLSRVDAGWFEDDGLVRFRKLGAAVQPDAPTVMVSPDNGLIGIPQQTDDGAEIETFLNPALRIGGTVNLQSQVLQGAWTIVALRHEADNWAANPFRTWCELRAQ